MRSMEAYPRAAMERAMKVQDVMLQAMAKKITWWQAAEILGISDRHMRRWRERYVEEGYNGLQCTTYSSWNSACEPFTTSQPRRQPHPNVEEHDVPSLLQCLGRSHLRAATDVIALELSIQGGAADTEHLTRHCLVSLHLFEDALNRRPFNVLQVGRGHRIGDYADRHFGGRGGRCDGGRQIPEIDDLAIAQCHGPLDAVFQFANVSRPVILQQALHRSMGHLHRTVGRVAVEKPVRQHGDIGAAFAQRR